MAKLELREVVKKYGEVIALDRVSFQVQDGEFLTILGRPGAGKTTILKIIAGVEPITQGKLLLGGEDVASLSPEFRDVAMVFETYALYPHLSIYDNIVFPLRSPLRRHTLSENELKSRVGEITEMLQISDLLDRKPVELSGGQRQRVSLARALVRRPQLFLMDEPIAHLDAKLRHGLRPELRNLQRRLGVATLFTTTDYMEALGIGERILVLNEGKVLQIGTQRELWATPASEEVGELLGMPPMNIIKGATLRVKAGEMFLADSGFKVKIGKKQRLRIEERNLTKVDVGIHPSEIRLLQSDDKYEVTCIGRIYVYEPLGTKGSLSVRVGEHTLKIQTGARFTKRTPEEQIKMYINERDIHIFDPTTRKNISTG